MLLNIVKSTLDIIHIMKVKVRMRESNLSLFLSFIKWLKHSYINKVILLYDIFVLRKEEDFRSTLKKLPDQYTADEFWKL